MLHVDFDWQKIYKIVLEKAFFFILWRFYLLLVLLSKNFKNDILRCEFFFHEIGHVGYNLMPPKKLKLKNE
jgi:hypothetical protein